MSKFTRRELAAALSTTAVVLARPQSQPPAANAGDELKASEAQNQNAAEQLDKFPLSMFTEPATIFHP
jgi:hypothetical protein